MYAIEGSSEGREKAGRATQESMHVCIYICTSQVTPDGKTAKIDLNWTELNCGRRGDSLRLEKVPRVIGARHVCARVYRLRWWREGIQRQTLPSSHLSI